MLYGFGPACFSEVAYIGCLNVDHRATAMLMLQHGKHVLCEKPLTVNLKETRELLQMAAKKRLFLMEVRRNKIKEN